MFAPRSCPIRTNYGTSHGKFAVRREPAARRRASETSSRGAELVYPARRLEENGLDAWATVKERGFEGDVAKDERSAYEGGATRRWLKVKAPG